MRISDWSSDVCSSDLHDRDAPAGRQPSVGERRLNEEIARLAGSEHVVVLEPDFEGVSGLRRHNHKPEQEIGRAHAELQSLMRISYAVFCLKKKKQKQQQKCRSRQEANSNK